MNIIVCCKQIVDPEAPPSRFSVDTTANRLVPPLGVAPVVNPFDEHAVEAALRIKDNQDARVTILTLGVNLLREVVKRPLAMGADDLILLEDQAFADGDSYSTAHALATAIKKIGSFDLIFCGRQAADWDSGQVGTEIAETLGLPSVTLAKKVEILGNKAKVQRVTSNGYQIVEVPLPALITVTNELGQARYPNIRSTMAAKRKEPVIWKPADLGLEAAEIGAAGRHTRLVKLFQPVREGKCEIVNGETLAEAGTNLATRLREARVL